MIWHSRPLFVRTHEHIAHTAVHIANRVVHAAKQAEPARPQSLLCARTRDAVPPELR